MKRTVAQLTHLTVHVAIFCVIAMCAQHSRADELKEGDEAPAFELPGSNGENYKLEDFKDKQAVVIAWFPKAFTGG